MCIRLGMLCALVAFGFVGFPIDEGAAQSYPTRQITIVIPFPAGGNVEIVARPLAERLSAALGQPVIIENRPGGAGGTDFTACRTVWSCIRRSPSIRWSDWEATRKPAPEQSAT